MRLCVHIILAGIFIPVHAVLAQYGGGTGTPDDPFLIYTAEQFNAVGANSGDWSKHFKLMNDIDLQGFSQDKLRIAGYPGLYSPSGVAVDGEDGKLYWTEAGTAKIQRANIDGTDVEDVVTNLNTPFGIALDLTRRKVYWTDLGSDKIQRANLDGSEIEDVVATGLGTPRGIALAGDKIYWTDSGQRTVCKASLDGSNVEVIVDAGLDRPMGIAVDPGRSRVYWADADTGKIQRANLNGANVVDIISSDLDRPCGIALDTVNHRIYWSDWGLDKIQSSALDGTELRDIVTSGLLTPYLMAVDAERGHLYWVDRDMVKIQRSNLSGNHIEDIIFQNPPFTGVLDGNGKSISNFSLACEGLSKIGLLGHVSGTSAEIRDLHLVEPTLQASGGGSIGLLVGQLDEGSVVNCHIEDGVLVSSGDAGGLIGYNRGKVERCSVTITTTRADGLTARNSGTISDCYVSGDIVRGDGLAGSNKGVIKNCTTNVHVDRGCGLVGTNEGMVTCSYAEGQIQGQSNIGGLIGRNKGTVTFSYADMEIDATGKQIGGAVGRNENVVAHCYAYGKVAGEEKVGGLVGLSEGSIYQCYAAAAVSGQVEVGGLVGDGNDVSESFWDIQTSGQGRSDGGTGCYTIAMQSMDTYVSAGWDLPGQRDGPSDIWAQSEHNGYPIFWWQLEILPELHSFAGGTGSREAPYVIATAEDLNSIGCNPRLMAAAFVLVDDIDLFQAPFHSIGSDFIPFSGHFAGNDHSISNMSLTGTGAGHAGLFGALAGTDCQIADLTLVNPEVLIEDGDVVATLAGEVIDGMVANCHVKDGIVLGRNEVAGLIGRSNRAVVTDSSFSGTISGNVCVGGLIGRVEGGTIFDSSSECDVVGAETVGGLVGRNTGADIDQCHATGRITGAAILGGLIGENDGTVRDCHSDIDVTEIDVLAEIDGKNGDVGGLIGLNNIAGQISKSFARGKVAGSQYVGGLCGENGGDVAKCYADVDLVGKQQVGGLVGWNFSGTIGMCFSRGKIKGQSRVGGLIGDNSGLCFHVCRAGGTVVDSYSQCEVIATDTAGGLLGTNGGYRLGDEGSVLRCYFSGIISSEGASIGGLTGFGSALSSFWDIDSSGMLSSASGSGKTTAEMQTAEIFTNAGWSFSAEDAENVVWQVNEGQDYPRLRWEFE